MAKKELRKAKEIANDLKKFNWAEKLIKDLDRSDKISKEDLLLLKEYVESLIAEAK